MTTRPYAVHTSFLPCPTLTASLGFRVSHQALVSPGVLTSGQPEAMVTLIIVGGTELGRKPTTVAAGASQNRN